MRALAADKTFSITYHEFNASSDKLVICFAPWKEGLRASGFGTQVCERNGWNHVYVGKAMDTRYHTLTLDQFAEALAPLLNDRDVIAYGASVGAYAALYYGGSIDARILAASPRNTNHPLITAKRGPAGGRAGTFPFLHSPTLSSVPRSSVAPVIVCDRMYASDMLMIERWALEAYPDARLIYVPNAGYRTLERLKKAGTLSYLLRQFVSGGEIDEEQLKFPAGTVDRLMDDSVVAAGARDWIEALGLTQVATEDLIATKIVPTYVNAVISSGSSWAWQDFLRRCLAGEIDRAKITGKLGRRIADVEARRGSIDELLNSVKRVVNDGKENSAS